MRHTYPIGLLVTLAILANACSADTTLEPDTDLIIIADVGPEDTGDSDLADTDTDRPDTDTPDADADADEPDADADEPDADEPDADADQPDTDPDEPWSCAPDLNLDDARYNDLNDLSDQALIDALFQKVDDHTWYDYQNARNFMYDPEGGIDVQADGLLHCPYTGTTATPGYAVINGVTEPDRTPDDFNTEHSWPRSDGANVDPAEGDIHHLFPTDSRSNSYRGNFEFGNTDCSGSSCTWDSGVGTKLGTSNDGRGRVFEVRMQNRGDMARAHFYFSVRYGLSIDSQEEAVLRQWNCQDPPDDWERLRNDRVEVVQNNRNPFVDRPDFVDQIADF
ncbi:hypothetical protein DL240_06885 [Lujinxingia litoralis]|uniref:Endonuclease I n=1 Tax=Lujinxingia litoralis TaxID=2211119 RepID=A0A328CAB0_9DELT|nr:endonuclease [Lujinxingia litoralis]RAL23868.1 hypothetical protein DL240_06885 [Lujinxingia litoralis]